MSHHPYPPCYPINRVEETKASAIADAFSVFKGGLATGSVLVGLRCSFFGAPIFSFGFSKHPVPSTHYPAPGTQSLATKAFPSTPNIPKNLTLISNLTR